MHHYSRSVSIVFFLCLFITHGVQAESALEEIYLQKKGTYPLKTKHLDEAGEPLFINRLVAEDSLYLLQHAHNPVDWWPWGNAALQAAQASDKPILLSIGYSTCHWCHVMERESFEDKVIADFINQHFIPIKVDREQHPDIDELYITAVQRLSGNAGWPLTAVLTPQGLPFFGGTYFPPQEFLKLLERINQAWETNRAPVIEQAQRVRGALEQANQTNASLRKVDAEMIGRLHEMIARELVQQAAGPAASTFPREPEMIALLDYAALNPADSLADALFVRLETIANSGLHDQIGGGFHRYSVDANWQVPHFEKMLYNQAQMAQVYASAWLLSGNPRFREVAFATYQFMLENMQSPEGGFYAAMDAESEGREGVFYTWDLAQLASLLSEEQLLLAAQLYKLTPYGNFANSHVLQYDPQVTTAEQAGKIKQKLKAARDRRPAPLTDTKIITGWNAMTISALARGYQTFSVNAWREAAVAAANRIWEIAWDGENNQLARALHIDTHGVLQDYAYFTKALLDLYDLSNDEVWLQRANIIASAMIAHFQDEQSGTFKSSANSTDKQLILNLISARDDAVYSGNSMAAQALVRLFHRTGDIQYRNSARAIIAAFSDTLSQQPHSHSGLARAANWLRNGETGQQLYAAQAKVIARAQTNKDRLQIDLVIEPGWHINASAVLTKNLIPTQLSSDDGSCFSLADLNYPAGQKVTLGFQRDPLMVYEDKITIDARFVPDVNASCRLLAAELRLQTCSDEVCLAPETLHFRVPLNKQSAMDSS